MRADGAAWGDWHARALCLALAVLAAWILPRLLRLGTSRRASWLFAALSAAGASALSAGYVVAYLRGGPRIIDATAYWLQARALAGGMLAFLVGSPAESYLGRFLLLAPASAAAGPAAAGIFPPGYPALLALGFLGGMPLAVGPLLAAALVLCTFDLARQVARRDAAELGFGPGACASPARFAALLSALCAVLRYHSADTMAHGLAALCFAAALAVTLRADGQQGWRLPALGLAAGLISGWLLCTRPVSGLALLATMAVAGAQSARRSATARRGALWWAAAVAVGLVPGLCVLAAQNAAATGDPLRPAQLAYYAVSDGPPGCFAYGFGPAVGCLGEHGDFVRANLPAGYGLVAALGTTGRRLWLHLGDALNFAPLFALVALGAALGWRVRSVRLLGWGMLLQVAAYAPFYFDGSFPGGGARMLADVLPLEHVLAAVGVYGLGPRVGSHRWPAGRLAAAAVAVGLLYLGAHGLSAHAALRDRDGGRPMFEPAVVAGARGLVLVDTDHGFNLGYDPRGGETRVARYRGDALDRLAWEALGRPPAYRYRFEAQPRAPALVWLEPIAFDPRDSAALPVRIEGESLWPARAQRQGWAWPEWPPAGVAGQAAARCASRGRWLGFDPSGSGAELELGLPASALAGRAVRPILVVGLGPGEPAAVRLDMVCDGRHVRRWELGAPAAARPGCVALDPARVQSGCRSLALRLRATAKVGLDCVEASEKR
ncbi:MAG: hypothetical protein HY744_08420 [Deltaproteobacteria bacterium]|nr:hypothetical protein [Deltaproteobacteria bacterium]